MLVDTHCHLGDAQFDQDRPAVIDRARAARVEHVVVVAESAPATGRAIDIARNHGLAATAGVHPHDASSWNDEVAALIESSLSEPEVVAVGETGLDYHYDHSPRATQREVFAHHLELAERFGMPVVIHARSADQDMAAMLRESRSRLLLHSFSSGPDVLAAGLERDAYFSFSGMITFRSWRDLDAVRTVPDHRVLIETDAPYLAPVPHRGQRNEPAYVRRVAERLAEIRGQDVETIVTLTTSNAIACFGDRLAGANANR